MASPAAVLSTKQCSKCGKSSPLESFPPRKSSRDGRHGWCRPCFRAYYVPKGQEWREANRERHRANTRRQYAENIDSRRAGKRDYDERNREVVNERARLAYKRAYADPGKRAKMLARNHQRREQIKSSDDLAEVVASLYEQPCAYCGATENIQIDHIVPLSRGGRHEIDNLAPACGFCNGSKKDKLLSEWERAA